MSLTRYVRSSQVELVLLDSVLIVPADERRESFTVYTPSSAGNVLVWLDRDVSGGVGHRIPGQSNRFHLDFATDGAAVQAAWYAFLSAAPVLFVSVIESILDQPQLGKGVFHAQQSRSRGNNHSRQRYFAEKQAACGDSFQFTPSYKIQRQLRR